MPDRPSYRLLLLAIGLMAVIRGFAIFLASDPFGADPDAYQAIARTIHQSEIFGLTGEDGTARAIAFRPPLYPWLLSWCIRGTELSVALVTAFHLLLAALTALFVYLTTKIVVADCAPGLSANASDRYALLATLIVAIDPILLRQSTEVMTETLAATLTASVLWLWCVWNSDADRAKGLIFPVTIGCLLALSYLSRPTFLVWAVLLVAAVLLGRRNRRGVMAALLMASVVAVAVGGWTMRNARQFGHPIWATTHGGYTLLLANNESFYDYLHDGSFGQAWDASQFLDAYQHRYEGDPRTAEFWSRTWDNPPTYATVSEYDDDRLCYESAVATIKRRPSDFCWSAIVRVGRLWSPFPHEVAGRSSIALIAVGCFYVVAYGLVLVSVVRHRNLVFKSRWWAVWLLAFTLTGVHAVYWSNLRMRAPIVPAIAVLSTLAFLPKRRPSDRSKQDTVIPRQAI